MYMQIMNACGRAGARARASSPRLTESPAVSIMECGGRRLAGLTRHMSPAYGATTADWSAATSSPSEAPPDLESSSVQRGATKLHRLSTNELAEFVRTGICVVQPSGLSAAWHEALSNKTRDYVQRSADIGHQVSATGTVPRPSQELRDVVGGDISTVLSSDSVHGALSSILGPDYMLEPGMAMHLTSDLDQTWVSLVLFAALQFRRLFLPVSVLD